jgi:hypothetical protein
MFDPTDYGDTDELAEQHEPSQSNPQHTQQHRPQEQDQQPEAAHQHHQPEQQQGNVQPSQSQAGSQPQTQQEQQQQQPSTQQPETQQPAVIDNHTQPLQQQYWPPRFPAYYERIALTHQPQRSDDATFAALTEVRLGSPHRADAITPRASY